MVYLRPDRKNVHCYTHEYHKNSSDAFFTLHALNIPNPDQAFWTSH